jgi:hypothetical protein
MGSMNPSTKSSWWHNATTEQRLAQIDGGLECGMTARQVALASRVPEGERTIVSSYARSHGRQFPAETGERERHRKRSSTDWAAKRARDAYLRGDPIDLWGNTEAQEEFLDEVVS